MRSLILACLLPTVAFADVASRLNTLLHNPLTGLPQYESADPPTVANATLGRLLFYDKRLSKDGTVACASCHSVTSEYSNNLSVAVGIGGALGTRKAPPLLNKAFLSPQFWDGRANSLEDQATGPLFNPIEMGTTSDQVVATLTNISGYAPYFQTAFGDKTVTIPRITRAISDFERTLMSGNSLWDRWQKDPTTVYPIEAQRGYDLFLDRDCKQCHVPPFFTDNLFHNTGIGFKNGNYSDEGRYGFTKLSGSEKDQEKAAFKTPTLRNLAKRAPYMHDGSMASLDDVVTFYNKGGVANPELDAHIIPLGLTKIQQSDLKALLLTLEGEGFEEVPPTAGEFPQ